MLLATGHALCSRDRNVVLWGAAGPCVGQQGLLSPVSRIAQGELQWGYIRFSTDLSAGNCVRGARQAAVGPRVLVGGSRSCAGGSESVAGA